MPNPKLPLSHEAENRNIRHATSDFGHRPFRVSALPHRWPQRQRSGLEERKASNGSVYIWPSYGQKDDVAVAVALAAFDLSRRLPKRQSLVEFIPAGPRFQSSFARPRLLERGRIRISS